MKAILLSIKPKYCELIASGLKTVEIRKTRPKIDTPFKVYIYCTKERVPGEILLHNGEVFGQNKGFRQNGDIPLAGKVIGEFICDEIEDFSNYSVIAQYLKNRKSGYGWHISDLKIYDEPKELNKFNVIDEKAVKGCEYRKRAYTNPDYTNGVCLPGSYICTKESETDWCSKCRIKPLTRPPQTWCYVENLEV